ALGERTQVLGHALDVEGPEQVARPVRGPSVAHVAPGQAFPLRAEEGLAQVLTQLDLARAGARDHRRRLHGALERARVHARDGTSGQVAGHRLRLLVSARGEPPAALPSVDDLVRVVDLAVTDEMEDGHTGTTWPSAVNS